MVARRFLHEGWEFCEADTDIWRGATVPGCVQLDLMQLGEKPDPFYRMDEFQMRDLEDKDWVYRTAFALEASERTADRLELVFEGIDTFADVYLNGVHLGETSNMFIPQRFDITDVAREGDNELVVQLHSTVRRIKCLERDSPLSLRSSTESARPYVRKAQYAFGWDWGPRLVQTGLWRPVALELASGARLRYPYVYTEALQGEGAVVTMEAEVEDLSRRATEAEVVIALGEEEVARARVPIVLSEGRRGLKTRLALAKAHLWWPNGYGDQPLYRAHISLCDREGVLDEAEVRFGIRTMDLLRERDDRGETFVFAVNGVRIFAKGANWIPADSLLPRLTPKDYGECIRLAAEAHMNMLRIWGGGIYEDPAFYGACDEMGILVWQDFTYACAQYPDELDWFQDEARKEAESVVRALRNHPSLALWCGNNENNWGFVDWWGNGMPKYLGNYIYREILPQVCGRLDPSRPYWVSSPYGGEHPNSMDEGDRHQWLVWSNWQDYSGYLEDRGRFISEFGFQAMPDWKTVLSYTAPEDRTILSPVMRSHNKMPEGTERLLRFLVGRLGLPRDLKSFVYLTQFNQAEAIRTGVEHWRLHKFDTAGTLYWQLNDCWPVASWSAFDYFRRKKALYYYTRRFFAPILPVLRYQDENVALCVVSDLLERVEAQVRVACYDLTGHKLAEHRFSTSVLPNRSSLLGLFSLQDLGIGYEPRLMPYEANGTSVAREENGALLDSVIYVEIQANGEKYSNYLVFDRFRSLNLRGDPIQVEVGDRQISLTAAVPAFGVFVETEHEVELSDNCLNLEPGRPSTIDCSNDPGQVRAVSLVDLIAKI